MPATIQDIARELGLSHTTVSRVLNARTDGLISDATRSRVQQAAHKMGYRPNRMARALVSGRSYLIEFLVQRVHPAYYSRTIQSLKEQLDGTPYELQIVETHGWTPQRWTTGGAWPADGIIVLEEPAGLEHLRAAGIVRAPLVSFGGSYLSHVDHVGVDLYAGALAAVRHLLDTGRRRTAYVTPSVSTARARIDGYAAAVAERGGIVEVIETVAAPGQTHRASARRRVAEYVAAHGCPDALFCFNDDTAIGALHGLKDLGLRVPEDAAIIGCDGIEDAEYQDPPLSTVAIPHAEMARLAWQFLSRRIEEPDAPLQGIVLTPELILRPSSASRTGQEVAAE